MRARHGIAVALVGLVGCPGLVEDHEDGLRHLSGLRTSGYDGRAVVDVDVDDEDALLLTAVAGGRYQVFVERLLDPEGDVLVDANVLWEDAEHSVTGGVYPFPTAAFAWPITREGPPLEPGSYTVELGVVDSDYYYMRNVDTEVHVLLKEDDDLEAGVLEVNLILAGSAPQDHRLVRATEEASALWAEGYAQAGIEVRFTWGEYPEGELPGPGLGQAEDFEAIAASTPLRSVNVVIVPEMLDGDGIYGMAGGIPGPLVPTDRSAVVISALTNSGPDLTFSTDETVLFAETMAHEVGHFLGLFHPVEVDYAAWDALGDTPECANRATCEDALGANLMFPYPVCSGGDCVSQEELSPLQRSTTHRYAGVE